MSTANNIVILVTFILFALALFVKGFTHDLLLEAGIFLVSVKLILATYHINIATTKIEKRLENIEEIIKEKK